MYPSRWHFELYTASGQGIADLSKRARNRRIVQSRNEPEEISWTLDLAEFERIAGVIGVHPNEMIKTRSTEVRIRRGQKYICGGQVIYKKPSAGAGTIEVRAHGFLNLFNKRFTPALREFTSATQVTTMYSTLITEDQTGTNRDFGVTIGTTPTISTTTRSFKDEQIKAALKDGAEQYNFDFEFTYNKVLNFYSAIGSRRPELVLEFPGNIQDIEAPEDGTNTTNRYKVYGSGSGSEGNVSAQVDNTNSQIDYKILEDRLTYSNIESSTDLQRFGNTELSAFAYPFQVPPITLKPNATPVVTDYGIGDYLQVSCKKWKSFENINGLFRVERREITIDENDNEVVKLAMGR